MFCSICFIIVTYGLTWINNNNNNNRFSSSILVSIFFSVLTERTSSLKQSCGCLTTHPTETTICFRKWCIPTYSSGQNVKCVQHVSEWRTICWGHLLRPSAEATGATLIDHKIIWPLLLLLLFQTVLAEAFYAPTADFWSYLWSLGQLMA